ncbi:hypothetical protein R6Q59_020211, partial [Mikania micrantha]
VVERLGVTSTSEIEYLKSSYVWILGLFLEPYYPQARIIATKNIQFVLHYKKK